MFANATLLQQTLAHQGLSKTDANAEARRRATQAFWRAFSRGTWRRLWARLTGLENRLLSLNDTTDAGKFGGRHHAGICLVPIAFICGSEGRVSDFDADFNPLKAHIKDRWVGIAAARLQGKTLPPVVLIQLGDRYYVRDGHHRISIAKAMGQWDIEAEVISWGAS